MRVTKRSRKRKDVALKTALRRCRRFLQQRMQALTGFVCSKKPKSNDPLFSAVLKYYQEFERTPEEMMLMFYLAALLHPQDTKRNISKFVAHMNQSPTMTVTNDYLLKLVNKVHDVLYKYSHEKLEYFCSIPALAFLFNHYYDNCGEGVRADS